MFYPWLWIDAKTRFYCGETSPNTRLKHPHHAVIIPLWINAVPTLCTVFWCSNFQSTYDIQRFSKCLPCLKDCALSVDGHPIPLCEFSSLFLASSPHLVYHCDVCIGRSLILVSVQISVRIWFYRYLWAKLTVLRLYIYIWRSLNVKTTSRLMVMRKSG